MPDIPFAPPVGTLRWGGQTPVSQLGTSQDVRATQQAVETLYLGEGESRVTQQAVEVLRLGVGESRVTQQAVEVLWGLPAPLRVTQQVIEILRPYFFTEFYDCGPPTLTPDDLCRKRNVLAWVEWDVDASTTLTYEA